jgi:hypothetical protein
MPAGNLKLLPEQGMDRIGVEGLPEDGNGDERPSGKAHPHGDKSQMPEECESGFEHGEHGEFLLR